MHIVGLAAGASHMYWLRQRNVTAMCDALGCESRMDCDHMGYKASHIKVGSMSCKCLNKQTLWSHVLP